MSATRPLVNDVTRLNPVPVWAIATPTTIAEVQEALRQTTLPVSIGGGRFSMGGQVASPGSLHLDLRRLNQVVYFKPQDRVLRVQAGIRWCDIQRFIDPHGFAVSIMQTYANFTVGGSLSVNVHGRYVGMGPLILSVRSIALVLPSGELVNASPTENSHLFYGAIGSYGALGVIVEAELELADNRRVERVNVKLPLAEYVDYFRRNVRDRRDAIFHNADIYAPHCSKVRAVTWLETKKPVTVPYRLRPHRRTYPLQSYFLWAVTETPFGKWRREFIIDPLLYLARPVRWRNYEAGYDVRELEPPSRKHRTYVLQEYFVPVERLLDFVPKMADILQRHRVNALNVSIRHAAGDPGTLLAWARGETFALVLYYKQRTRDNARERVAVWTRELIDAVLDAGGSYYLPYQPHATPEQFHQAYPRASELFALKAEIDPLYRLRNSLWDRYYRDRYHRDRYHRGPSHNDHGPSPRASGVDAAVQGNQVVLGTETSPGATTTASEFHAVYGDVRSHDAFYRFLLNIYHLYPEDRFHTLIKQACNEAASDETIYRKIQEGLPAIKPFLSELTYAVPALIKQKKEMTRQTLALLDGRTVFAGYVEIGSTGRYVSDLRRHLQLHGEIVLVNDVAPGYSPVDIVERGRLPQLGRYVPLNDYAPLGADMVQDASADLVTCYIGLHHIAPEKLQPFLESIYRVLRPGGLFIVRDHDVKTPEMFTFVSLAHAVFNAGLGLPWETNREELRLFVSVDKWVRRLLAAGFADTGKRLLQPHDPTDNVLMAFEKPIPPVEATAPATVLPEVEENTFVPADAEGKEPAKEDAPIPAFMRSAG